MAVINMQVKPQMKIYPLMRDTCLKNKIVIEKMLTKFAVGNFLHPLQTPSFYTFMN